VNDPGSISRSMPRSIGREQRAGIFVAHAVKWLLETPTQECGVERSEPESQIGRPSPAATKPAVTLAPIATTTCFSATTTCLQRLLPMTFLLGLAPFPEMTAVLTSVRWMAMRQR
jgi:hypothetical protein